MEEYKIVSKNETDTMEIAENIESEKFPGMVICLDGELGSGKTVFVKGFARALGIDETITSPTFNLIKEYNNGELSLYHMDVYRIDENSNIEFIEDYLNSNGICIIEWSETIKDRIPEERLEIKIIIKDENTRILVIKPYGAAYEELCSAAL